MKNIDPKTPIWKLTVEEFIDVSNQIHRESKYTFGLQGLADLLGCSVSTASKIKSSGMLKDAIFQRKHLIVINKEKALKLFDEAS